MKSLKRIRNRWNRCYELASRVMIEESDAGQWRLVHGERTNLGGHAWISLGDGRIYDPVYDEYFAEAEYYAQFRATPRLTYSRTEAARCMRTTGHYGPWHDDEFPDDLKGRAA